MTEVFPVWMGFSALIGVLFWLAILWLVWVMVSSMKGIHTELTRIREALERGAPERG